MGGILTGSIPVFVVENATDGNRSYTTMHEGEGKVLRFGVYDHRRDHLVWMRDVLGTGLSRALKLFPDGGLPINPILALAVTMGDDFHVRITAASSLFFREMAPKLARVEMPQRRIWSPFWISFPGTSTSSSRSGWHPARQSWTPRPLSGRAPSSPA